MNAFDRGVRWWSRALMAVAGAILVLMMLHVVADAVAKNILRAPIDGTLQVVSTYYMVPVVFLPLAFVELRGENFKVEFLAQMLGPRAQRPLTIILHAAVVVVLLLVSWFSAEEAWVQSLEGELWESALGVVPVWPSRWLVPIGCLSMALSAALLLVREIRGLPAHPASDGAPS